MSEDEGPGKRVGTLPDEEQDNGYTPPGQRSYEETEEQRIEAIQDEEQRREEAQESDLVDPRDVDTERSLEEITETDQDKNTNENDSEGGNEVDPGFNEEVIVETDRFGNVENKETVKSFNSPDRGPQNQGNTLNIPGVDPNASAEDRRRQRNAQQAGIRRAEARRIRNNLQREQRFTENRLERLETADPETQIQVGEQKTTVAERRNQLRQTRREINRGLQTTETITDTEIPDAPTVEQTTRQRRQDNRTVRPERRPISEMQNVSLVDPDGSQLRENTEPQGLFGTLNRDADRAIGESLQGLRETRNQENNDLITAGSDAVGTIVGTGSSLVGQTFFNIGREGAQALQGGEFNEESLVDLEQAEQAGEDFSQNIESTVRNPQDTFTLAASSISAGASGIVTGEVTGSTFARGAQEAAENIEANPTGAVSEGLQFAAGLGAGSVVTQGTRRLSAAASSRVFGSTGSASGGSVSASQGFALNDDFQQTQSLSPDSREVGINAYSRDTFGARTDPGIKLIQDSDPQNTATFDAEPGEDAGFTDLLRGDIPDRKERTQFVDVVREDGKIKDKRRSEVETEGRTRTEFVRVEGLPNRNDPEDLAGVEFGAKNSLDRLEDAFTNTRKGQLQVQRQKPDTGNRVSISDRIDRISDRTKGFFDNDNRRRTDIDPRKRDSQREFNKPEISDAPGVGEAAASGLGLGLGVSQEQNQGQGQGQGLTQGPVEDDVVEEEVDDELVQPPQQDSGELIGFDGGRDFGPDRTDRISGREDSLRDGGRRRRDFDLEDESDEFSTDQVKDDFVGSELEDQFATSLTAELQGIEADEDFDPDEFEGTGFDIRPLL